MTPDEYAESLVNEENREAMFVGTVWIPGETGPIQISAPIPEALARQIGALGVTYDLNDKQRKKDAEAKAKKLKELQQVPREFMKEEDQSRFNDYMGRMTKSQQDAADQQRRAVEKMNNPPWPQPSSPLPSYPTVPFVPPQGSSLAEMFEQQKRARKKGQKY